MLSSDTSGKMFDLQSFMDRHMVFRAKVDYTYEEVEQLIEQARAVIQNESALCEIPVPVNVVGDIHGQFTDLQRIFSIIGTPGENRYLFLGDYVDRGEQSMECICVLLGYKIAFPDRIFLLRGNHECQYVNRTYGFYDELERRFHLGPAMKLFKSFNELFTYFPLAALIRNRILCMHGGLSPHLNSLHDIRNIPMPVTQIEADGLAQDLLWADPKYDINGFEFNSLRECSVNFGEDVVRKTCQNLKLDLVIRAHQVMKNGYGFFAGRKLVTIFSAPRYIKELNNRAAILRVNSSLVCSFVLLNPVTKETAGPEHFRKTFKDESTAYSSAE